MDEMIRYYLDEDLGEGDITTNATIPGDSIARADIIAKEAGVIAGHAMSRQVFVLLDPYLEYVENHHDGQAVEKGWIVAVLKGRTRAILTGERVALNILQRLSGIATATRHFVDAIAGTKAIILDTRKTTPGFRMAEKYAVRMGGGSNHRLDLSKMALIKDNHITASGSIKEAVQRVRTLSGAPVEVEVRNMKELQEALDEKVDRIMLDNWTTKDLEQGVSLTGGRIPLEASGNITLERVREVAETGVDFISVGSITHSFKALDLSLLLRDKA
jgi:nicotinate-nucleotide pyrophosphorylase (carboxylating)